MEMLRSREEWFKVSIERGTSGDMVLDILTDWKLDKKKQATKTYSDAEEVVNAYTREIDELVEDISREMVLPEGTDVEEQRTWELLVLAFFLNYTQGEILAEVKRLK